MLRVLALPGSLDGRLPLPDEHALRPLAPLSSQLLYARSLRLRDAQIPSRTPLFLFACALLLPAAPSLRPRAWPALPLHERFALFLRRRASPLRQLRGEHVRRRRGARLLLSRAVPWLRLPL